MIPSQTDWKRHFESKKSKRKRRQKRRVPSTNPDLPARTDGGVTDVVTAADLLTTTVNAYNKKTAGSESAMVEPPETAEMPKPDHKEIKDPL